MATYLALGVADTLGLGSVPLWHGAEAATQSWTMGALLIDSSGRVAIGASDPSLGTILGIATGKATGVTDADVDYVPALTAIVFEGNFDDGTGTLASLITHVNGRFGLTLSAGKFYVDSTDTTNIRVCVIGFRDPLGTLNSRCYFVFLPNSTRMSFTAV